MVDLIGFMQVGVCLAKFLEKQSPMRVYETTEQKFRRYQKEQEEREKDRNETLEAYDYYSKQKSKRYDKNYQFTL